MSAKFAHLHVHSHYSLLGALPKIPQLVARAKAEGCTALALTDLGNLYGAIEFYKECKSAGIKPIIGLEALVDGQNGARLLLYAENEKGYKNLLALVTAANFAPHEGKPIFTKEMLAHYKEGLVAAVPAAKGANEAEYKKIFGAKNFYANAALHEIFYMEPGDRRAWETLKAIENRGGAADNASDDLTAEEDLDYHFPTAKQMESEFAPEQLAATLEIAGRCNVELTLGSWVFPDIALPKARATTPSCARLLKKVSAAGSSPPSPRCASASSTSTASSPPKGYAPYFLVVADLLRFAREHKILTTIRGSVAGSLVTYVIGITNVNPLEYKIPFERFLNPERPSARTSTWTLPTTAATK